MKKSFVHYQSSERFPRHVCLDEDTADIILDFLEDESIKKKFDYILDRVLEQDCRFYKDYIKLTGYEDLTEFRLFPNGINARIYCKEVTSSTGQLFIIGIVLLPKKKPQTSSKQIKQTWNAISKYEYDVEQ